MTAKTPGSGGTDQTNTVEAGTVHLIRLIQSLEADNARNPSGLNYVTSSVSEDSRSLSASISLPCNLTTNSDQTSYAIAAIDYFTVPSGGSTAYTAGSGGTFRGTNVQQALIQHLIAQKNLELDSVKNPAGASCITYSIDNATGINMGNAIFTATLSSLPLEVTNNSNGQQTTSGHAYLL